MNTIVVRALAKINLAIDVLSKREDGYHEIDMITIPLKLHDSVEITKFPANSKMETYLYCDDPTIVCDESNLAYKALNAMRENFRVNGNFRMCIHKRIPVQAGLGGGSADAAAVIKALDNYMTDSVEDKKRIEDEVALSVGSDVPFCLYDKPSRVQGRGEVLLPIKVKAPYQVLIVKPNIGLSTKSVYDAYDLVLDEIKHPDIPSLIKGLEEDDETLIRENMVNVLSVPAIKALPLIQDLLNDMTTMGLTLNGMSGTGSACFALHKDRKTLERAMNIFVKKGFECYLTEFAI
jgi:4-diphosphocytidyl-2-C-methyl-D-erythritol kinase